MRLNEPRPDRPGSRSPSLLPLPCRGCSVEGSRQRVPLVGHVALVEGWLLSSLISDSYNCRLVKASQLKEIYRTGTYGSIFGFFGTRSLPMSNSSSSFVLGVGSFLLRSEKRIRWFQTSCYDWTTSFFGVSLAMTPFATPNAVMGSFWRRMGVSEKVAWEARVLWIATGSFLRKKIPSSWNVSRMVEMGGTYIDSGYNRFAPRRRSRQ